MDPQVQGDAPSPPLSPEFVMDSTSQDENPTALQTDLFHDILGLGDYLNQTEPEGHGYVFDSEAGIFDQSWPPVACTSGIDRLSSPPFVPTQDNGQSYQEPTVTPTAARHMSLSTDEQAFMGSDDYVAMSGNDNTPHVPLISTTDYDAFQAQIQLEYQYQAPAAHDTEDASMVVDRDPQRYRLTTSPASEMGDLESTVLGVMDQYGQFPETDPWTTYSVGGPASAVGIRHAHMLSGSNNGNSADAASHDQLTSSNIEDSMSPVTSIGATSNDMHPSRTTLRLPPWSRRRSASRGPASPSSTSMTTSSARTVECSMGGCGATFSGTYSKGNLARHIRLKHGKGEKEFPCSVNGCPRGYKRKDALLKHLRKAHPELGRAAPIPRSPNP